ncbi:MAG: hypothetical protein AMXMBFR84_42510 [Candidatus Hydrogenedentota bacterium]
MKPGKDTFVFKNDRPWPNMRMGTAAIVGHTTSSSTRLWFRTGILGDFRILLFDRESANDPTTKAILRQVPLPPNRIPAAALQVPFSIKNWNTDSTTVVDITDLAPDTEYFYALYWLSDDPKEQRVYLGQDDLRRFRTMPPDESLSPISFGFYSCNRPFDVGTFGKTLVSNIELWDMFLEALDRHSGRNASSVSGETSPRDLRFVIGGGDQVYVDGIETLDIWKYLNKKMRLGPKGALLPTKADMVSWYRDIYRGYWGFPAFQQVHSNYPTYMIWDDHEIHDGWGSYDWSDDKALVKRFLPSLGSRKSPLTIQQGRELAERMVETAKLVYEEYEHSHNPKTPKNQYDYGFYAGPCAFYVLDGRGVRDLSRPSHRILGKEQHSRFREWLGLPSTRSKPFLFVVSAVPVFHLRAILGKEKLVSKLGTLADDLRDSWENELNEEERSELLETLFEATTRGQRVSILSGDVHVAAAFSVRSPSGGVLYQLTSSAITYNVSRMLGMILGLGIPDSGRTDDGYEFERLALYRESNFSIVKADPNDGQVTFQLYGRQAGTDPERELIADFEKLAAKLDRKPSLSHSIAKLKLDFR